MFVLFDLMCCVSRILCIDVYFVVYFVFGVIVFVTMRKKLAPSGSISFKGKDGGVRVMYLEHLHNFFHQTT